MPLSFFVHRSRNMIFLPSPSTGMSCSCFRSTHLFLLPKRTSLLLPRCYTSAKYLEQDNSRSSSSSSSCEKSPGFEGIVPLGAAKMRLDSWLASQLPHVSRSRVQSSIRQGLTNVNGWAVHKTCYAVQVGDHVKCTIPSLLPLKAEPEDLPLDIVYEDDHVLVVNKPAHMVTHPAPGNLHGTLVNAILHHCDLPLASNLYQAATKQLPVIESDDENYSSEEVEYTNFAGANMPTSCVRPGIVHRLDKGTSGLLVVAKNEHAHEHLSKQFHSHKVKRCYTSLTCGVPPFEAGRVDASIARDLHNRIRMAVVRNQSAGKRARAAASRYRIMEVLVQGGSAIVEWRLETGRTHQIRVHAQHLGYPILGDELYGGTKGAALACLLPKLPSSTHDKVHHLISQLQRPCLHASTLGFIHPQIGRELSFTCPVPKDFEHVYLQLQQLGSS
eukprot:c20435_g1_i2 orf=60-1388(+)